jgi:hypothetical protein
MSDVSPQIQILNVPAEHFINQFQVTLLQNVIEHFMILLEGR